MYYMTSLEIWQSPVRCKTFACGTCAKHPRFCIGQILCNLETRIDLKLYYLQVGVLSVDQPNYPYGLCGDVHVLARCPDKSSVAVGYSNGDVSIFNYIKKTCTATLRGHKSSVVSLSFDSTGSLLASGGADSDIFVWDMMTLAAVCRLRGHKDAVTGVGFIKRGSQQLVVSVSKDTLMKVWDLDTVCCIQTIVGHRCEIWSLAITPNSNVITGSSDQLLRGYRLLDDSAQTCEPLWYLLLHHFISLLFHS